MLSSSRSV